MQVLRQPRFGQKRRVRSSAVFLQELQKWLCDGFKDISHQLYFVKGGNGAQSNSRGNACFSINLYTGEDTRIERYEVLGEVPEDKIPEFAKEHLANARAKYAKEIANERRKVLRRLPKNL